MSATVIDAARPAVPNRLVFTGKGDFLKTLRARVEAQLGDRVRAGDPRLHRKAAILALWFAASYGLMLWSSGSIQILFCILYALGAAALGFNVFHDANHGAFSASRRVNRLASRVTCALLGPSRFLWDQKHHVFHHVFTNVFRWDDDIETRGHLRMSPRQPWQRKFTHQHLFFIPLYALSTIEWFFVKDFVQYFTQRMTHKSIPPLSAADKLEFWTSKALYMGLFVALPFAVLPAPRALALLLLFHVVFGLTLTFVFQIAHGTEKVAFPEPCGDGDAATIEDDWAAHELRTTVNFGIRNRALNWFAGGLNFQVEHHLFPHLSHTYYPEISTIVRRTALEYGLPYNVHDTYRDAVASHFRFVRALGRDPRLTGQTA